MICREIKLLWIVLGKSIWTRSVANLVVRMGCGLECRDLRSELSL